MEIQVESMEAKVTSAVIEQSELMHDKHDLGLQADVCGSEGSERARGGYARAQGP